MILEIRRRLILTLIIYHQLETTLVITNLTQPQTKSKPKYGSCFGPHKDTGPSKILENTRSGPHSATITSMNTNAGSFC